MGKRKDRVLRSRQMVYGAGRQEADSNDEVLYHYTSIYHLSLIHIWEGFKK